MKIHKDLDLGSEVNIYLYPAVSIRRSPFIFSSFLSVLSSQLLPKCPRDLLQHCSCPPARNWGSRVSSLLLNQNRAASWLGRMGAKVLGVATPSLCPNKFYDVMKTICLISMYLLKKYWLIYESWTTLLLNPYFTKGWEPLQLSMVFNPDPSQLSLILSKSYLSLYYRTF